MAELADALDLGSSGTPVQVQVLSPAPKMDACRTAIKHLFHFWGGTPVLDVCYAINSIPSYGGFHTMLRIDSIHGFAVIKNVHSPRPYP